MHTGPREWGGNGRAEGGNTLGSSQRLTFLLPFGLHKFFEFVKVVEWGIEDILG